MRPTIIWPQMAPIRVCASCKVYCLSMYMPCRHVDNLNCAGYAYVIIGSPFSPFTCTPGTMTVRISIRTAVRLYNPWLTAMAVELEQIRTSVPLLLFIMWRTWRNIAYWNHTKRKLNQVHVNRSSMCIKQTNGCALTLALLLNRLSV